MFDISWGELLIIGVVALVVIGPKELPGVLRTTGLWMGKIRRMASEFQDQFREAMREAEMADLKKHFDDAANTASSYTNFDPIGTVRKEIESVVAERPSIESKPSEITPEEKPAEVMPPAAEAAPAEGRKSGEGA
jgi:sec-independent protein translocase protein TatB